MCSTTATCCFNLSPIPSISPKVSRIPRKVTDSRSWSGQSAVAAGLAYAAIGIGVSSLLFSESVDAAVVMEDDVILEVVAARRQRGAMRWSEKRACPPWRSKSFEQVVPENLPRASRRGKIESIGNGTRFWDAPGVAGVGDREKGINNGDCFSL